jgi:excisionase family DNA binding protein
VSDAARRLDATDRAVRKLFDRGELAGMRSPGGYRLIEAESLERFRRHLTVTEAAHRLGVSIDTIRSRFDLGDLAGYRTDAGHRRIAPEALEQQEGAPC